MCSMVAGFFKSWGFGIKYYKSWTQLPMFNIVTAMSRCSPCNLPPRIPGRYLQLFGIFKSGIGVYLYSLDVLLKVIREGIWASASCHFSRLT